MYTSLHSMCMVMYRLRGYIGHNGYMYIHMCCTSCASCWHVMRWSKRVITRGPHFGTPPILRGPLHQTEPSWFEPFGDLRTPKWAELTPFRVLKRTHFGVKRGSKWGPYGDPYYGLYRQYMGPGPSSCLDPRCSKGVYPKWSIK